MAEHGAHLTSSRLDFSQRPSIFEVLAQESLASTIRPALKHAVKVFAEKYPAQLGSFLRFYDEIYLVLDGLLQHHYLKALGASFAENFYSLQRISSERISVDAKLDKNLVFRSLACLVLIPYVKTKFDSWFEDLQYKYPNSKLASVIQPNQPFLQRLSVLYLCLYPHMRSLWEFSSLLYQLSYMLKNGRWHSPSMHLAGVELMRATEEAGVMDLGPTHSLNHSGSWSDRLHRLLRLSASTAAVCLSYSVSVSVFFLQFLDWWYSSDTKATALTSLPIPQPPKKKRPREDSVASGKCPLCMKQLTNSTALSASGYVFCYPCIHQYVCSHHCCPVTGYPTTEEHLVKIYEQDV